MITNLSYLKTAIEALEEGQLPVNEIKILRVMSQICEMNVQRIETEFLSTVDFNMTETNHDVSKSN